MRIGRFLAGALLVLALPVLAACSSSGGSAAETPTPGAVVGAQPSGGAELDGTSWVLQSGPFTAGDVAAAGITLEFADGTMAGSSGVNRYSGTYTSTTDGSLQVGPLASTKMAGPPEAMQLEQEYLTALQQTFGYTADGATLTLFGAADQVLVFSAA